MDVRDEQLLGQYIPLHYHGQMLADQRRVSAFREAIEKLVPLGSHVVELGGGTGVLSFFAAQRARKVSCVEQISQTAAAARRLLRENGAEDKVTVFEVDASKFVPDEPADVVLCEMLHAGLLREKQIQVLRAFKAHHRARFGVDVPLIIPEATLLALQLVSQPYDFGGYRAPLPLFFEAGSLAANTHELALPRVYATVNYVRDDPEQFSCDQLHTVEQSGTLNALRLVTKNLVGIITSENRSTDWHMHYLVLPLATPIEVTRGEQVRVTFAYEPGASIEALVSALRVERAPAPTR